MSVEKPAIVTMGNSLARFLDLSRNVTSEPGVPQPPGLPSPYADAPGLSPGTTDQKGYYAAGRLARPDLSKTRMFVNRGIELKPGHALITSQKDASVYQMDLDTGEFEFVFQLYDTGGAFLFRAVAAPSGEIFCTVTGARYENDPHGVNFGVGGAVFRIHPVRELISVVPRSQEIVDPCGLQLLPDGHLLVTDFDGFRGESAKILDLQPSTGKRVAVAEAGPLNIPIGAYLHVPDNVLYVANAIMQYDYPDVPNNDTGNLLRYDLNNGVCTAVVPEEYPPAGSLLGVNGNAGSDELVFVTCGAPMFKVGALKVFNMKTGEVRTLIASEPAKRRFFSPHSDVIDGVIHTADSYQKELLVIRLADGSILKRHSLAPILGGYLGVKQQFDIVDCVSIVPPQWPDA